MNANYGTVTSLCPIRPLVETQEEWEEVLLKIPPVLISETSRRRLEAELEAEELATLEWTRNCSDEVEEEQEKPDLLSRSPPSSPPSSFPGLSALSAERSTTTAGDL